MHLFANTRSVMWLFCGLCGSLKRTEEGGEEKEQYKKEKVP